MDEVAPTGGEVPAVSGYDLLRELGRGGMAVAYLARELALKRLVALKVILAGGHAGERERNRLSTEAEAVARLRHPGIVQIYRVGEDGGRPYLELEFVEGGSLAERLEAGSLTPTEAAKLLAAVADATESAHRAGVVHRDLKPANILLTADGFPKVTDCWCWMWFCSSG